jgi:hypothetical protein
MPAAAQVPFVFKYDQFPEDIGAAAQQVSGIPLATQPGFVAGEGFGQTYRPDPSQYPIEIQGIDVIVAAPPNGGKGEADATIEIWLHDGDLPAGGAPSFSLSTGDVFNPLTGDFGAPLTGNAATQFEFDWTDPEGHPPVIDSGNFTVLIRFSNPSADLSAEWGSFQCSQQELLGMCGCQQVGTLNDQATTKKSNVLSIIYPPGTCSGGNKKFVFADEVGVTGDFILRARTIAASGGPCVPSCGAKVCGSDGCGGSCGDCEAGQQCKNGKCEDVGCEPDCGGKECGADGCGGSCGDCPGEKICNNSGECVGGGCDAAANCAGKECGDDGCGGVCGVCNGKDQCVQGKCTGACAPQCDGKDCGDDGCGGVCGVCEGGAQCVQGTCQGGGVGADVTVLSVSPSFGYNDEDTDVSIVGTGFKAGATVKLGGTDLSGVQVVSSELISAKVPEGMEPATYVLIVANSDGGTGTLLNAFEVKEREVETAGSSSGGCSAGGSVPSAAWLLFGLLVLVAGAVRARRVRA